MPVPPAPTPSAARRATAAVVIAGLLLAVPHTATRAADPQPYKVNLPKTSDPALAGAIKGSLTLLTLQKSAPVGGFALIERARDDR